MHGAKRDLSSFAAQEFSQKCPKRPTLSGRFRWASMKFRDPRRIPGWIRLWDRSRGSNGWGREWELLHFRRGRSRNGFAGETIGGDSGLTKCPPGQARGGGMRRERYSKISQMPSQLPGKIRRACSGSCARTHSGSGLAPNVERQSQGALRLSSARGTRKDGEKPSWRTMPAYGVTPTASLSWRRRSSYTADPVLHSIDLVPEHQLCGGCA